MLSELKKLPSVKGYPSVLWNATGGTKGKINTAEDLRMNLANGMEEDDIDKLSESKQGKKVIDDYINDRNKRSHFVKEETGGILTQEGAKGEQYTEYVADHHTGEITQDANG